MLQSIRDRVSGWIAVTIIVLLIIPFAFWGINYYFKQGGNVNVLKVDGSKISLQEYQQTYQIMRQQWQRSQSDTLLTPEQETKLKQQTVDALINRELQNHVNADMGLYVGDNQLKNTIRNISAFQGADGFDKALYESYVNQTGMSVSSFERQLRNDLVSDQSRFGLIESEFLTDKEINLVTRLINQTRDIEFAILSSSGFKEKAEVSDADIQNYYHEQSKDFMIPEQVKIAYVDLSMQKLADDVQLTENDLRNYYNTNKANYEIEEQRGIKQIFIKITDKNDKDEIAKANNLASTLLSAIKGGSSMDNVVKQQGKNTGFDVEITNNDFLTKGILDEKVDDVVFNMKKGEISDPIQTDTGIYIVKLEKITGGKTTVFDDVRDQVETDYRHSKAETKYFDIADKLANLAFENPDSLEVISEKLGLTIHKSDFINRDQKGDDFLSNPKILSASFSEDVMINGNNSEPIEVGENHIVVLRVLEHQPEKIKPLKDVREAILTRLKYEKARTETEKLGKEILAELKKNTPKEKVTEKYNLEWKIADDVKRDNKDIDPVILRTVFGTGRPEKNKSIYSGASLASGDYAVTVVHDVKDNEKGSMTNEEMQALQSQLQQMDAINTWNEFMSDLKARASIEVFSDNL